jgi:hypothetical protein
MGRAEPAGTNYNSIQPFYVLTFIQCYDSRKAKNPTASSALEATLGEKIIPTFRNEKILISTSSLRNSSEKGDIGNSIEQRMEDPSKYSL